jgi:hypothetical protein
VKEEEERKREEEEDRKHLGGPVTPCQAARLQPRD